MKKQIENMFMPGCPSYGYTGFEPVYSQEFIESEEDLENNFYSLARDDRYDPGDDRSE